MKFLFIIILLVVISTTYSFNVIKIKKQETTIKKQNSIINLAVDNTHPGVKIPNDFLGLSYEITALSDTVYFKQNHTRFLNLLNNLGDGVLRLNGYYTNFVPWANRDRKLLMAKGNMSYLTDSIATSDLDTLFSFMRLTKWKVILGVNFTKATPSQTLSEVSYAWSKGKDVIKAFEIGNEPDGMFKSNFANYMASVGPHYDLIKKSLPQVPLCGPASVHPELFGKDWIKSESDKVNFTTIHEYPVGDKNVKNNINQLLDNESINRAYWFSRNLDSLTREKNTRYRIGECNSYGDEGIDVADRFASALWGIDYMFTVASNNALGVNFHGGSRGFTPIMIKKNTPVMPQPLYYAMLFFHLAGQGNIVPVNLKNSDNPAVRAYAVLGANHTVLVTILNKDPQSDAKIHLTFKSPLSTGSYIQLLSTSVSSKDGVTLGGSSVDKSGKWKASAKVSVTNNNGAFDITSPKGSATLITLN